MWHVYLLHCIDGSTYTGIATDVDTRFQQHVMGRAARHTRVHPPATIIAALPIGTRAQACRFEIRIKHWPRTRKIAFFQAFAADWRELCDTPEALTLRSLAMIDLNEALCVHIAASRQLAMAEHMVWAAIKARTPALADAIRQAGLDDANAARWVCFPIEELGGSPANLIAGGQTDQVLAYVLRVVHGLRP